MPMIPNNSKFVEELKEFDIFRNRSKSIHSTGDRLFGVELFDVFKVADDAAKLANEWVVWMVYDDDNNPMAAGIAKSDCLHVIKDHYKAEVGATILRFFNGEWAEL